MSNLTKYARYEDDALAHEEEQLSSGSANFLKLHDGDNSVRILPPLAEWGTNSPFVITYQHTINIPGIDKPVRFNCPRLMAKKPCLACMKMDRLRATGDPADKKASDELYPKLRVLCNAIHREEEGKGPQVWGFGKRIYEQLVSIRKNPKKGGDFTNPEEDGFDIEITKKGQGLNTTYALSAARESSPLGNMEWLDMQADLRRFAAVPDMAEMKEKLEGEDAPVQGEVVSSHVVGRNAPNAGAARRKTAADHMDMSDDK